MIQFVLLDLDDTILDFHRAEAAAIRKTLSSLKVPVDDAVIARYSEINAAHWRRLESGEITRPEVLTGRFRQLFAEIGVVRNEHETQQIYEHYLSVGHYFISGAEKLLDTLHKTYRLFLVSNGNAAVQEGRLKSANISHYFEKVFISEIIGADKPNREFFDRCFAQIDQFQPDRAILIGDSLTSDILGGINAGVRTCWFNPQHRPEHPNIKPDYEIDDLAKLPVLLNRLE